MTNLITDYLEQYYDEVKPREFYRVIFPKGELQKKGNNHYNDGKYNGIIVEVTKEVREDGKNKIFRHTVTDDLSKVSEVVRRDNFCLMSPISYVGKERNSSNARALYALAIDLDGIIIDGKTPKGLITLFHQINNIRRIPEPTFIVSSGTGVHLYYVFEKPIMLFDNVVKQLQIYKKELTRIIWQGYITSLEKNVQYESLFQGFRIVGTITKKKERARAFRIGDRVTMKYMNEFVRDEFKTKSFAYKSNLTLEQAKKKYPEWYQKRIVKDEPKGTWTCNRAVYDWWKEQVKSKAKVGHRYFCLMMLSIYARKSGITQDELEKDAFELMEYLDTLETDDPFNEKDVLDSLEAFNDRFKTYPINSISYLTDIPIQKNKRNFQKQKDHLEEARAIRDIRMKRKGIKWDENNGRKQKKDIVLEWQSSHPGASKYRCIKETGLSKPTVYKWWDNEL